MEEWKIIDGYNYFISNFGNVENAKTGRILQPQIDSEDYYNVVLYKNGKGKTHRIHQLVAQSFLENPDDKQCVDHIDGNKLNNQATNLRFATFQENSQNRSMSKNNTSGVKGVCFDKHANKWCAYIRIDGILIHIGYFETIEEAQQARIERANQAFGTYVNSCERL